MVGYPRVTGCSSLREGSKGVRVCGCVCVCVCPFLCQKLLLNGWADFLQTWWEGALGWALVSRRLSEPKVRGQIK